MNDKVKDKEKKEKKKINFQEFMGMLRSHRWSRNTTNFLDFFEAAEKEARMVSIARFLGPAAVRELHFWMNNDLKNEFHEKVMEAVGQAITTERKAAETGDVEFDQFRHRLCHFDWHFDKTDMMSVYNARLLEFQDLKETAIKKGGIYAVCWNHNVSRVYGTNSPELIKIDT